MLGAARRGESRTEWDLDDEDVAEHDDARQYFATCIPGLHEVLAAELTALGADGVETSVRDFHVPAWCFQ